MRLTELFTGDKQITAETGKTQQNIARTDTLNRQIRSMVPGQTIQGEVVSRNGNEVQIRLSDDLMLQAKLDQNMNLEIGKNMTFEVKNNGKALVLSPLFTNVATDANVLKALDMASLPVNGTTVSLTKQLMEAGLSIDRNTLQQVYREVSMFPEAQTSDIVNLHKMQMPVNQNNLTQMSSYRNLTYQLVTGMNNVLDAIPDMFSQMMESGNTENAVKLYQQLVLMAQEGAMEGTALSQSVISGDSMTQAVLPDGTVLQGIVADTVMPEQMQVGQENAQNVSVQAESAQINGIQGNVLQEAVSQVVNQSVDMLFEGLLEGQNREFTTANGQTIQNTILNNDISTINGGMQESVTSSNQVTQQLQSLWAQTPTDLSEQNILTQLNHMMKENDSGKALLEPLMQLLKQQWTITPEQVADSEQVENLYHRLDKQIKNLAHAMENAGQINTPAHNAVMNMAQNLDFMQQVNQMYTYVQLPLRLQNGEAHGDLYVYTNKKHLAAKDGQISALLHLDMEHLGPVDVYVSMMNEKVNTKFYLQDDDILDFIMEHMDILTQRLQKRGYQCSFEMQVHDRGEETKAGIQKLLEQENHIPLAEYAFDVRT